MSSIVVFDGECGLCNGFVAWLVRRDRAGLFLLAGSAGAVGRQVVKAAGLPRDATESTIVLWRDDVALTHSDAVLSILEALPWPWKAARAARVVPRSLRDRVYAFVAARRPRVDAEDPACGVPPRELVEAWMGRLATSADVV
jgi:predicted DCC family thiol-disulfide oxidoreductase YuxK